MVNKEFPLKNVATSAGCLVDAVDYAARNDLPIIMIDATGSGGGEPEETYIGKYYISSEGKVYAKAFAISSESITEPSFGEYGTISMQEAQKAASEFGIRHLNGKLMVFDSYGEEIERPDDRQMLNAVSDVYFNQIPWQDGILVYCG